MMIARMIGAAFTMAAAFAAPAVAQTEYCPDLTNTALVAPGPESLEGAQSHIFKSVDGADLRLHVFYPEGGGQGGPAVILFFGGGWMIGGPSQFEPQARALAARGVTAILPDYRTHCRDGADVAEEIQDARSAVRWVRAHADDLGVDPDRVAAAGGSSGGHLALATATFTEFDAADEDVSVSARPDLLVLFYPCVDLTADTEQEFSAAAIADWGPAASPLFHVASGLPSAIIFQGTADPLYDSVKTYCTQARAEGNRCDFVEYAGAPHGFFNAANASEWYDDAAAGMDAFLVASGYLPPAP